MPITKISSHQKQRHRARCLAMQALYQWHYNHCPVSELVEILLKTKSNETKLDYNYFIELIQGSIADLNEIDTALQPVLDRKLSELNPVELAILRLLAYEIIHKTEIPYRVIINEGVELAKEFGSCQAYKYVNAVLDKLTKQYRFTEMKHPPPPLHDQ